MSVLESTVLQRRGAKRPFASVPDAHNRCVVSRCMFAARKISLRVNGVQVANARVWSDQKGPQLVVIDPRIGDIAVVESFTLELLELVHPWEIRNRLPNGGWRRVSLRILIALLRGGIVRVVGDD